jgi:hypothetical protein
MMDVMDFEEVLENYYDGDLETDHDYGISVYDISQLDWALEDSRYNSSVVDEEGGEY